MKPNTLTVNVRGNVEMNEEANPGPLTNENDVGMWMMPHTPAGLKTHFLDHLT